MTLLGTTAFLTLFTIAFILMDEYIAKPIRHKRMVEKAKTDPEVKRALEIGEEVEKLRKEGKITF
jgi:hypothetical protein